MVFNYKTQLGALYGPSHYRTLVDAKLTYLLQKTGKDT